MDASENDRQAIGTRVRHARTSAGLSLRETARRIEVSPATLSAIENGTTGISIPRLRALAAELGTTAAWLIGEQHPAPARDRGRRSRHRIEPDPEDGTLGAWREFPPLRIDPVLTAAIDSFVETGYHGATIRSIAHRAGMSVPGVYHHYSDKQHLLVRALDLTMDELQLAGSRRAPRGHDRPRSRDARRRGARTVPHPPPRTGLHRRQRNAQPHPG